MISESDVERNATSCSRSSACSSTALIRLPLWASASSRSVGAVDRLRVLPRRGAGRRVAHVAERHVAGQRAQLLLVEDLGDEPEVAQRHDVAAVGRWRSPPTPGRGAGARTARSRRGGRRRGRARRCRRRRTRRAVRRDRELVGHRGGAASLRAGCRSDPPGKSVAARSGTRLEPADPPGEPAVAQRRQLQERPARARRGRTTISTQSPPTSPIDAATAVRSASRASARCEPDTRNAGRGASPRAARELAPSAASSMRAPMPPARQHSASATARPPSATSCALCSAPRRTASRTRLERARTRRRGRASGSAVRQRLAAQLRQLGARQRRARTAPTSAIASPSSREAEPAGARGVGQPADHADDRRRVDRAVGASL